VFRGWLPRSHPGAGHPRSGQAADPVRGDGMSITGMVAESIVLIPRTT
jgi:hypothetical protein